MGVTGTETSNAIKYVEPSTIYCIPSSVERRDISLAAYKVLGKVESSSYGVKLNSCVVEGNVLAYRDVTCLRSFCKSVTSRSYGVNISDQSKIAGGVVAYRDVSVSNSTVEGAIDSRSYGVRVVNESNVNGAVSAYRDIAILASSVNGQVNSRSYGVTVSHGSKVGGSVSAYRDIKISDCDVNGDIVSRSYAVNISNASCNSKLIKASRDITIKNTKLLNPETVIQSSSYRVTLNGPKEQFAKVSKILASRDIHLSCVSSDTVHSSGGSVSCSEGELKSVKSLGSSALTNSKIENLELSVERGKNIELDLTGSSLKNLSVKVVDAVSTLSTGFIGSNICGSMKSICGNNLSWQLNGSSLNVTPRSFMVEGVLGIGFEREILLRCRPGTRGVVNGMPAKVSESGKEICIEKKEEEPKDQVASKVTIIGGEILGEISFPNEVELDTAKTTTV